MMHIFPLQQFFLNIISRNSYNQLIRLISYQPQRNRWSLLVFFPLFHSKRCQSRCDIAAESLHVCQDNLASTDGIKVQLEEPSMQIQIDWDKRITWPKGGRDRRSISSSFRINKGGAEMRPPAHTEGLASLALTV